jgi:hypothetical protein
VPGTRLFGHYYGIGWQGFALYKKEPGSYWTGLVFVAFAMKRFIVIFPPSRELFFSLFTPFYAFAFIDIYVGGGKKICVLAGF